MYFFTADQHYGHNNIIKHCNRPFDSVEDMDKVLIDNHNSVVEDRDIVIHVGDFCWHKKKDKVSKYIKQLNGQHIFIKGSHDYWLKDRFIWEKKIEEQWVVACHYAMRTWSRSHYGSWMLHGHSHGRLDHMKNQWDVGVDNNYYTPVSFDELDIIMRMDYI